MPNAALTKAHNYTPPTNPRHDRRVAALLRPFEDGTLGTRPVPSSHAPHSFDWDTYVCANVDPEDLVDHYRTCGLL